MLFVFPVLSQPIAFSWKTENVMALYLFRIQLSLNESATECQALPQNKYRASSWASRQRHMQGVVAPQESLV